MQARAGVERRKKRFDHFKRRKKRFDHFKRRKKRFDHFKRRKKRFDHVQLVIKERRRKKLRKEGNGLLERGSAAIWVI
jgi:hypothetical protein